MNVQFKRSLSLSERLDAEGSSGDGAKDDSDASEEGNETDNSKRGKASEESLFGPPAFSNNTYLTFCF